jgi:hypothetical protein
VSRRPKPALPAPNTSRDITGPSGTSIPPPTRPVAMPKITDRTTGFCPMKRHPSASSRNVCRKSMRPLPLPCPLREIGRVAIRSADTKNVPTSTQMATVSWLTRSVSEASYWPSHSATLARRANSADANGKVP